MCGFPSDKMYDRGESERFFLYKGLGEARTDYSKGLIDYEIKACQGMSGSPLLAKNEKGKYY